MITTTICVNGIVWVVRRRGQEIIVSANIADETHSFALPADAPLAVVEVIAEAETRRRAIQVQKHLDGINETLRLARAFAA